MFCISLKHYLKHYTLMCDLSRIPSAMLCTTIVEFVVPCYTWLSSLVHQYYRILLSVLFVTLKFTEIRKIQLRKDYSILCLNKHIFVRNISWKRAIYRSLGTLYLFIWQQLLHKKRMLEIDLHILRNLSILFRRVIKKQIIYTVN